MVAKCSICLGEIIEAVLIINCNHNFCHHCIKHWLAKSNKCPYCTGLVDQILILNKGIPLIETISDFLKEKNNNKSITNSVDSLLWEKQMNELQQIKENLQNILTSVDNTKKFIRSYDGQSFYSK